MNRQLLSGVLVLSLAACADSADFDIDPGAAVDAGASGLPGCLSSNECPVGFTCSEFGTCLPPDPGEGDAGPGVEIEVELSAPTHSERYVYVAMSELDSLAKIDGATLEVSSISVGDQPEILAAIPGSDGVVVLDQNSGTVTIIKPTLEGNDVRVVPTLPNMNRLSVDPTGSFALAWFDLRQAALDGGGLGGVGEIGSFQDVTVIRLEQDNENAVDLTVGFRPREIEFDVGGNRAYVITDDGISVIELADVVSIGPHIVAPIPLGGQFEIDPVDQEVNVTASGNLALVRELGQSEVRVVQLLGVGAGATSTIALPGEPTDVDVSTDGETAYAVLRESSELGVLDLTGVSSAGLPGDSDLTLVSLGGAEVGSLVLSPQGDEGVLFTNASSVESLIVVRLDDGLFEVTPQRLQKSIRSLGYDPTGRSLIVTHAKSFGDPRESGIGFDEFIDRSFGYSIVDLDTGFAKLQITTVDPGAFQFSQSSPRAYVLLSGGEDASAESFTHVINLTTGIVKEQRMSSPPETLGILPEAEVAFVNQTHALGRISFIHVGTDAMRTVTGFDLNSQIVD